MRKSTSRARVKELEPEIMRLYSIMRNAKHVAKELGITDGPVRRVLREHGVRLRAEPGHSDEVRFFDYVDRGDEDECWPWRGGTKNGYGYFHPRDESAPNGFGTTRAYRWSYQHFVGPIPAGHDVHHVCYNRLCVNPKHLRAATRRANVLDSPNTVSGAAIRKTKCKHGHAFTPENTLIRKTGHRACRQCIKEGPARRKAKTESPFLFDADKSSQEKT
jgi:hypothetical protein